MKRRPTNKDLQQEVLEKNNLQQEISKEKQNFYIKVTGFEVGSGHDVNAEEIQKLALSIIKGGVLEAIKVLKLDTSLPQCIKTPQDKLALLYYMQQELLLGESKKDKELFDAVFMLLNINLQDKHNPQFPQQLQEDYYHNKYNELVTENEKLKDEMESLASHNKGLHNHNLHVTNLYNNLCGKFKSLFEEKELVDKNYERLSDDNKETSNKYHLLFSEHSKFTHYSKKKEEELIKRNQELEEKNKELERLLNYIKNSCAPKTNSNLGSNYNSYSNKNGVQKVIVSVQEVIEEVENNKSNIPPNTKFSERK